MRKTVSLFKIFTLVAFFATGVFAAGEPWTLVMMPDTQNYSSESRFNIYTSQTQWIVDNLAQENIKFVTHVGDLVNHAKETNEWRYAAAAMDILNGKVPYGVSPGNHDLGPLYIEHMGADAPRWKGKDGKLLDTIVGFAPGGMSSAHLINVDGQRFLFLQLNLDCPGTLDDPETDLGWAQSVVNKHRGVPTVMSTHHYHATRPPEDRWHLPAEEQRGPSEKPQRKGGNSPMFMRENFVKKNNEIFLVLCGHNHLQYHTLVTNDFGNVTHEVLADYQAMSNGGNGFLRLMKFVPAENKIEVSTYSPWLKRMMTNPTSKEDAKGLSPYLTDPEGASFTLKTDLDTRFNTKTK